MRRAPRRRGAGTRRPPARRPAPCEGSPSGAIRCRRPLTPSAPCERSSLVACRAGSSPKRSPVDDAHADAEEEHPHIGFGMQEQQRVGRRQHAEERARGGHRKDQPDRGAGQREQQALYQKLTDERAPGWRRSTDAPPSPAGGRAARATSRLATFEQAMSRMRPAMPISTNRELRVPAAACPSSRSPPARQTPCASGIQPRSNGEALSTARVLGVLVEELVEERLQ